MGRLMDLTALSIDAEKCVVPPPETVRQGAAAVVAFLQELDTAGFGANHRVKLLLLGPAEAGKTSPFEALRLH